MSDKADYKSTLNLPETSFPMKADLAKREPELLKSWKTNQLYPRILAARQSAPVYAFHDGPPYANGHIHYGHILNKILKDIVCKYRTMAGRYVEYKPGWDCHGLPIELAVMRELGDKIATASAVEIRRHCHEYAQKWVDVQREEFQRLGVFGTWETPYLTIDKEYESTIVRQLAQFAEKGLLYRAKKPVHWCMSDKTALAEAEIEYDDAHVSPSIYVKFAFPSEPGLYAVIWTTTPWTLPANYAIAYHPEFSYVTVQARGEHFIVAEKLADAFVAACKLEEEGAREPFAVERFALLREARHPFMDRASRLLPADYVTLEQGTGLVHTAPGHGADDYLLGKKFDLPIEAPVDDSGVFTDGPWKGEHVFKANPKIVTFLAGSGALLSPPDLKLTHSYPICWRCKNPVLFRATWQWFARMDDAGTPLRKIALDEIGHTKWIPPWGENRIRGMIGNRPDWVLSRQRVWGVPIPVLYKKDGEVLDASPAFMNRIADLFAEKGSDAWFTHSAEELAKHAGIDAADVVKGNDIVDVWFESGVSWAAVCEGKPGLSHADPPPIDLYLEGSDQHRGWFHSSLLCAAATRGRAPYRTVLTHGFVMDERGKPYSKSSIEKARREGIKIEYIPPEDVLKAQGAELLRLWTAQADFRSDMMYSRGHLNQLGESYRKIRNTARFLLGNLFDYQPEDKAATQTLDRLDEYVLARAGDLLHRVVEAYEAYEFHVVFRALVDFCTTDLSALYLDVRKDRLYCDAKTSPARRGTQFVLEFALRAITRAMAPILCFTAEEIWSHMPRRADDHDSVHLELIPNAPPMDVAINDAMEGYLKMRAEVQAALEPFRAQKKSSLDAQVTVPGLTDADPAWLADLFIVSKVTTGGAAITVADADGNKCGRCWKWTPESPPLCARCRAATGG